MSKVKKQRETVSPENPRERWQAVQLTDDERAELRRAAEAELDRARSSGVYQRLLHLRGKVKFSLTYEEMADKVGIDDRD
jgi:SpoVK/Ycf46/Vps4 family AAA+-type ATPase